MTQITEDIASRLSAGADERVQRLDSAGGSWSSSIDGRREAAHLTYSVTGEGEGAVATRLRAGKHEFWVDEPAALAGDDVAPSPVEVALGALISCQVVVYRLYAHLLKIPFEDISVTAEGDLDAAKLFGKDEAARPGFTDVRLQVSITGPESQERYEQLRAAVDEHCPVLDLFSNPTPVTSTVRKA
ncbi:OsmC family protein [Nesterenkonia massiliensis]|uniref:OsmC family protein n=1 Tax=Nesterenkonia massiliensis TaxID=1232429 RepID=A0ABT2HSQ4_9MICC|nr:OsmC family protein [Nesterenkonia massiliensis]MCT1607723.1 OsmC family protein [Nesterenkonia massiliensis]